MADNTGEDFFYKLCSKSFLIHLKACKSFLGVNRRSTNFTVIGGTGRYPLIFDIVVNMFIYNTKTMLF